MNQDVYHSPTESKLSRRGTNKKTRSSFVYLDDSLHLNSGNSSENEITAAAGTCSVVREGDASDKGGHDGIKGLG